MLGGMQVEIGDRMMRFDAAGGLFRAGDGNQKFAQIEARHRGRGRESATYVTIPSIEVITH